MGIENSGGENSAQNLLDSLGLSYTDLTEAQQNDINQGIIPNEFLDLKRLVDQGRDIPEAEIRELVRTRLPDNKAGLSKNFLTNLKLKVLRKVRDLKDNPED